MMDSIFSKTRLSDGRFDSGFELGLVLTEGSFWVMPAGCHTVYRGQDGVIDYDTIQGVMLPGETEVAIAAQDLPADTIWHYVRREVSCCGLESASSSICIVRIDGDGDIRLAAPNDPVDLSASNLAAGKIKLRWRYHSPGQEIRPNRYNIYMDSGSGFDFSTPTAYVSSPSTSWTSGALTDGQRYGFVVRAANTSAGESQNTASVSIVAKSTGPEAITDITATWEEL